MATYSVEEDVAGPRDRRPDAGAKQSTLREANLGLVARTVCASPMPISRAGIAAQTSMTRSTASRLVDELVAGGVLAELDPPTSVGPGRPATPLVAGQRLAALGLQINATYLAARVIDLRGGLVAERTEIGDFVGSSPEGALARLGLLAEKVLNGIPGSTQLVGAGLALPGVVARDSGRLLLAPNLGWSDLSPPDLLKPHLNRHLDLHVGNEADLAALTVAESAPGRPSRVRDFIYLSGEIGIGGAAVVNGAVMSGRHGWAGEIGHVCVDPDGPPCPCGSTGCLERYAGRHAILKAAGLPSMATADDLVSRVEGGDPRAAGAVARASRALGIALSGAINLLDIPTVVLGGHLGQIADLLEPELVRQLGTRVLSSRWVRPTIAPASADLAPGATGAAMAQLGRVLGDPAAWLSPS